MAAANLGASRIVLGIGGSATNDGGIGCAQACGLPVILKDGEPLSATEPLVGADIERVVLIKHGRGSAIEKVHIEVACDVDNPLYGPSGAAEVYGPQKGASAEDIRKLDHDLTELARRCGKTAQAQMPGAGAAGGLGFGMAAFFGASLRRGIEIVIDAVGLKTRLAGADLCITGEGRLDGQSLRGKTVAGVAGACREVRVPCCVIAGSVEDGIDYQSAGIERVIALADQGISVEESMRRTSELLERAAFSLFPLSRHPGRG